SGPPTVSESELKGLIGKVIAEERSQQQRPERPHDRGGNVATAERPPRRPTWSDEMPGEAGRYLFLDKRTQDIWHAEVIEEDGNFYARTPGMPFSGILDGLWGKAGNDNQ